MWLSLYWGQGQDFRLTFRKNLHQKTRGQTDRETKQKKNKRKQEGLHGNERRFKRVCE